MNAIDKNIRKLRKERKLSQEQLAERLHVTRQAVSSWETGVSQS
ncbi:helix-turn-helix transcriptional regulator [Hungatella effluvii]|nr:helix-turn-helix transcriptional regulator [Hungatella effluvii]